MTMAVMCQRVSEEEEVKGTGVGPEAERHSRKGRWREVVEGLQMGAGGDGSGGKDSGE